MLRSAYRLRASVLASRTSQSRAMSYSRLVRFIPQKGASPVIGEPADKDIDVGLAVFQGKQVKVDVFSGESVLKPGNKTGKSEVVGELLSPLAAEEVGTIRCIGLNYTSHAEEVGLPIPTIPVLFLRPATALIGPHPAKVILPRATLKEDGADYEAELALVIGKDAKDVSEESALQYLGGITAAHDVSQRVSQFAQSQWCFSKGFDTSNPLGPVFVSASAISDLTKVKIRGELNGKTVQQSTMSDLIFSIPKIISFVSQGTTLPAGTIIITGTPAGVGWTANPRVTLKEGDEFRVEISHGVGTLINKIVEEAPRARL